MREDIEQCESYKSLQAQIEYLSSEVARLEQLAAAERLNPEKLMQDLKTSGKNAAYLSDVDAIVAHVSKNVQGGDVVCVFSNGGFGGIHGKLLERLGRR